MLIFYLKLSYSNIIILIFCENVAFLLVFYKNFFKKDSFFVQRKDSLFVQKTVKLEKMNIDLIQENESMELERFELSTLCLQGRKTSSGRLFCDDRSGTKRCSPN